MRVRWIGLALVLAVVGAAAGYGVGHLQQDQPATFPVAAPVPADNPSYPVIPVVVKPDPDFPALQPGLRLHPVNVGVSPYGFRLQIPRGWSQINPTSGEWHWYPPPEFVKNTYFIRVKLLGNLFQPVASSIEARVTALDNAVDVADLRIESRTTDRLVVSYVSEGYRRVSMEQFVADDGGTTYASIALVGRESDRAGMDDLFPRIIAGAAQH
jgi:hypothetical protein